MVKTTIQTDQNKSEVENWRKGKRKKITAKWNKFSDIWNNFIDSWKKNSSISSVEENHCEIRHQTDGS